MTVTESIKKIGWSDEEYQSILEETITKMEHVVITDISSPPGTRKTFNTMKYVVKKRQSLIASFPTHTNQETALEYIILNMEEEKPAKLPMFVLDYGGVENYCIFYRPSVLMKFLDKFKKNENDTYTDAVENMLGHPVINSILIAKGADVDDIWYEIGRILDEYVATKDIRKYRKEIKEIIERKGQHEICRNVCPVGLFFWYYRRNVYHELSEPKVITWRKSLVAKIERKYPHVAKHTVLANPECMVKHFDDLAKGRFKLNAVLCPRLLLIAKSSLTEANKPNYIAVRRSIILTPHSGLDFVVSVVKREHEIQRLELKHVLFIDEYDALLRPKMIPVHSLSTLSALIAVADNIIKAGVGATINGIYVDAYLHRYAKYVYDIATEVYRIVTRAIETKTYHPLVNLFIEGAFSEFEEKIIKTKERLVIPPLSPRYVHIKFFTGSDLLPKILNMRLYFEDFAQTDPEWRINVRIAEINFNKLAKVKVSELHPVLIHSGRKEIRLRRRTVRRNVNIIPVIREYVRYLMYTPRYAWYYTISESGTLYLATIDVVLHTLLHLKGAVLVSASPVLWHMLVRGPLENFEEANYHNLVRGLVTSLITVTSPKTDEYSDRQIREYIISYYRYKEEDRREIENAIEIGKPIPAVRRYEIRTGKIIQIAVLTTTLQEYSRLLKTYFPPSLQSLYIPPPRIPPDKVRIVQEKIVESIRPYLQLAFHLRSKHTLMLVQNKFYASLIARILGGKLCHGTECGDKVKKPTHYQADNISITWFRSRAERGIDLPYDYYYVIVVGSPYPKPSFVAPTPVPPSLFTSALSEVNRFMLRSYNTNKESVVTIAHTPHDIMQGIAELTQAVGRATRSALRHGRPVQVIIPAFLRTKIEAYAPGWLRGS